MGHKWTQKMRDDFNTRMITGLNAMHTERRAWEIQDVQMDGAWTVIGTVDDAAKACIENEKQFGGRWVVLSSEPIVKCHCGKWMPKTIFDNFGECLSCDHLRSDL